MNEKIKEVYIQFKPTDHWRRLAPNAKNWSAWYSHLIDYDWQITQYGLRLDEKGVVDYGGKVYAPDAFNEGIEKWLKKLSRKMKKEKRDAEESLSFFCDQLLAAGVASEIVEKNVWTFEE